MKLYTRLIDEGVFVFWNSDGDDTTLNLKIRITVGDEKVTLVDYNPIPGQNYYSLNHVGLGDYEVELNGYRGGQLYQTEVKKIQILGSIQKTEEYMSKILEKLTEIARNTCCIDYIEEVITNPLKKAEIDLNVQRAIAYYERYDKWPDWDI